MILNSSVGSVTDILNTRNIITDVRKKVPNLKRFGRHSSIAQSVEHAAVNRRVVCSSQTGGAKHLLGCVVCPERGVRGKLYMKSGPLAQLVRATGS